MTDKQEIYNPLGTDGFEFVEYTAPDAQGIQNLKDLFISLGFAEVAKHRSKEACTYLTTNDRKHRVHIMVSHYRWKPCQSTRESATAST